LALVAEVADTWASVDGCDGELGNIEIYGPDMGMGDTLAYILDCNGAEASTTGADASNTGADA